MVSATGRLSDKPMARISAGTILTLAMLGIASVATAAEAPASVEQQVDQWARQLAGPSPEVRQRAEVRLCALPPDSFGALEAALRSPGLEPQAAAALKEIVDRERPLLAARLRQLNARVADWHWNEQTALTAYDTVGKRNPDWDAAAREGIKRYALLAGPFSAREYLEKAIQAGCDDPLVLYYEARVMDDSGSANSDALERLFETAADSMEDSNYPADRKCLAILRSALYALKWQGMKSPGVPFDPALGKRLSHALVTAANLLPEALREPGLPDHVAYHLGNSILELYGHRFKDKLKAFERIYPAFEQAFPNRPLPLIFKGAFYTRYAWDARGNGFAYTVTPQGWKLMADRLSVAEEALTKAWRMDPTNPQAAVEMITVELGQGRGRNVMETWYRRALEADPDNLDAVRAKMHYLEPKWYGGAEDMLIFAAELRDSKNYHAAFCEFTIEAHFTLSGYAENPDAYLREPAVWAELRPIFEHQLAAWPDNHRFRSRYAYVACRCGQWATAKQQFDLLGDRADAFQFGGNQQMEQFRRQAAQKTELAAP